MSDDAYEADVLDLFAGFALAGLLANGQYAQPIPDTVAEAAYCYARSMVAVRAKRQPKGEDQP